MAAVSPDDHDHDPTAVDDPVDPDDPRVDTLFIAGSNTTSRRYHEDPECDRLKGDRQSRRAHIAAAWYPPCKVCVTQDANQGGHDDAEDGGGT